MRRLPVLLALAAIAAGTAIATPAVPAGADQAVPVVTVLERGTGPRTELRYHLAAGDEQLTELAVLTRINQKVGSQATRSGSAPRITLDMRTKVTDVAADGVFTATYAYEAVHVGDKGDSDSSVAREVREKIKPILGLTGTITMTAQGEVLSADVAIPDDADADLKGLVEQLSTQASSFAVPFPTEAIGRGAEWKAKSTTTVNAIEFSQTTEYTVRSIRGDRVELSSTLQQHAKHQTYTDPASDNEVELFSSDGTGDGTSSVRLGDLIPPDGEAHIQVKQKLEVGGKRISQTVTTHVFIDAA
jgi:hypothetical protein